MSESDSGWRMALFRTHDVESVPSPPVTPAVPHVFQSLWLGTRLSPLEHLCLKSFLRHGHTFVLYAYDEVDNVPPGCAIEDARAILGEDAVFMQRSGIHTGSRSTFSNQFRYELLRTRGGWWVDTDVLCLKHDIPDPPYVFAKQDEHTYACGVLKAPPDSAFLAQAATRALRDPSEIAFLQIGPMLVTELVRELGLEDHAWACDDVYPLRWDEVLTVFDPARTEQIEARIASATFMHFSTGILRLANIVKDIKPPKSSYLDCLYAAYDVEVASDLRYEWAEIQPQYLLQQDHWRIEADLGLLRAEVARLREEREQTWNELAIRLARKCIARLEQSGRWSPLARAVQASRRLVDRAFVR